MTNVQNKQENVSTQSFVQIPHYLMKAKYYLSRITGNPVKLSASDKWVYAQMQDRWKFFTGQGKSYWDTQQQVADAVGMERKTVMVIIQSFVDHGIFEVTKKARNNIYSVIHDLELCSAPTASHKASKSVSNATHYPIQGLEEIVESKDVVGRYSEPEGVMEKVIEEIMDDDWENDREEESEVVFVEPTLIPVQTPTPAKDPSKVYAGDYFSHYPTKFSIVTRR